MGEIMHDVYQNHVWHKGEGAAFQKTDPVFGGLPLPAMPPQRNKPIQWWPRHGLRHKNGHERHCRSALKF